MDTFVGLLLLAVCIAPLLDRLAAWHRNKDRYEI